MTPMSTQNSFRRRDPKDTVFYIGCSDVELAYWELTTRGLKAEPPKVAPYGLKLFSAEDPDGYTIVFQETVTW